MPRRAATVTQADVARIVRAVKSSTGARVRVTLEGGKLTVEEATGEGDPPEATPHDKRRPFKL